MSDSGHTITFLVDQTPEEVFAAVTDVREWWSQDIEGPTDELDGEFTYRSGENHHCTMRIVELVPGERVVWLCLDNHFGFTRDKTEWIGTKIVFEISEEDGGTRLRFTHQGLVPDYECFDVCTTAWDGYVAGSLRSLITTGRGDRDNAVRNAKALARLG
ncbi:SRPBCC domain-containing protein [Streptosporangium sp. NPDC048047]|uniref:SRPBCC family protein n=1 Tax=Streptosporangium sp. NPDC048047 TaxID=3155748 RepID=UPI0034488DB7